MVLAELQPWWRPRNGPQADRRFLALMLDLKTVLAEIAGGAHDRLAGPCSPEQRHHLQQLRDALTLACHHAEALALLAQPDR